MQTHVVFIGGRAGVGKTTVAAEMHAILTGGGVRHALIDGDNLDMAYPVPWREGHALAEANLRAMWQNYQHLGYTRLIYTNTASVLPAQIATLTAALGSDVYAQSILLTASDAEADRRLGRRELGSQYASHAWRSRLAAREVDREAQAGVLRLATDGRRPVGLAHEIIDFVGWRPTR